MPPPPGTPPPGNTLTEASKGCKATGLWGLVQPYGRVHGQLWRCYLKIKKIKGEGANSVIQEICEFAVREQEM